MSPVRHIPNILTGARLAALPVIVWTYGRDAPGAAWPTAWIVLFAALSDVADGIIARRWEAASELGRWLDPIVDRLFFFVIVATLWYYGTLPWLAALPLLIRDGVILVLAAPTRRFTDAGPQISRWGKAGNVVLVCALEWFIIDLRPLAWAFFAAGGTLYIASGLLYLYRAVQWLRGVRV